MSDKSHHSTSHLAQNQPRAASAFIELIRDAEAQPIDYRLIEANDAFLAFLGLDETALGQLLGSRFFAISPAPLAQELSQILGTNDSLRIRTALPALKGQCSAELWPAGDNNIAIELRQVPSHEISDSDLARRLAIQERLLECARYLTESLDVKEVLERIGAAAGEILNAHGYAIYLLEEDGHTLTPMVAHDPPYTEAVLATTLDIDHSFTGMSVRQRRGLVFNDADNNPVGMQIPGSSDTPGERVLAVPFCLEEQVLGAMCLNRLGKNFAPADLALAEEFAIYATTALHNARLYDRVQHEQSERRAAQQAQQQAEQRLSTVLHSIDELIIYQTPDHRIIWANRAASSQIGMPAEELAGRYCYQVWFDRYAPCEDCPLDRAAATGMPQESETSTPDGRRWYLRAAPVLDKAGTLQGLVEVGSDITDRAHAEQRMRQITKMEALGRLAGDVAHDFNNQLTVIIGDSQLLLSGLPEDSPLREELEEISSAGRRAAALTRRLLLFSRREGMDVQLLDLNETVRGVADVLQRLIGDTIQLRFELDPEIGLIQSDPMQMEQVLLNLAINARDAIEETGRYGGTLSIETEAGYLDESQAHAWPGFAPGPCVCLRVSDTGMGMPPEVREHVFEPFFTTKEAGRGTGLGLSIVYNVVTQSGGAIDVESVPNEGTTFIIYLPVAKPEEPQPPAWPSAQNTASFPLGKVMLLDDPDQPDETIAGMLRFMGFEVVSTSSQNRVHALVEEETCDIDLVIAHLAAVDRSALAISPPWQLDDATLPILYLTDPPQAAHERSMVSDDRTFVLGKPFDFKELANKISRVLGK